MAPGERPAPQARILEGALFDEEVRGLDRVRGPAGRAPRFADCEFEATYPFGRVVLSDPGFPVEVARQAFNPLVPGRRRGSAGCRWPSFRVALTSRASEPLDAASCSRSRP